MNKEYEPYTPTSSKDPGVTLNAQVQFKAGGPRMLVIEVGPSWVLCKWFDTNHHVQKAHFTPEELEVVG